MPKPKSPPGEIEPEVRHVPVAVVSAEVVTSALAKTMLGCTVGSLNARRSPGGPWIEGKHWHKRDGTIWYDIPAIERWVRTGK